MGLDFFSLPEIPNAEFADEELGIHFVAFLNKQLSKFTLFQAFDSRVSRSLSHA